MCLDKYMTLAKMLAKVLIVSMLCVIASSDEEANDSVLKTVDNILATGYPAETHQAITFDGYVLEMHRIPYGRNIASNNTSDRPVVFLMHGLMSASNVFIGLGADYSVAYNLADAGFDVWMGNARGNMYSRRHITLDPDHDIQKFTFFDFTFEEIGLHDLPAMIDYALEYTQTPKLHYIGHSQGGTVFLVFLSLRPDYNKKIASAHLLAAVGYQEYFPNQALAASAEMVDLIYNTALSQGIVELYPEFFDDLTPSDYKMIDYCKGVSEQSYLCELQRVQYILRNDSLPPEYTPAGASLKQAAHYGQNIRDKLFRRYHYGTDGNMENYGLEEPPLYDISVITTEVTMHYTVSDDVLDERAVLAMAADMPNVDVRKVARESFLHADFLAALDAKELVTDYIIEAIRNTPDTTDEIIEGGIEVIIVDDITEAPDNPIVDDGDGNEPDSATSVVINMYLIMLSLFLLYK